MSKAGRKSGGGDRTLTPDEASLWQYATSGLDRVKGKPRVGTAEPSPPAELPSPSKAKARKPAETPKAPPPPAPARSVDPKEKAPAPLADFDRRKARQIASGRIEVEDTLDLHGCLQREAHARLRAFLHAAFANGLRTVLIVTGKGDREAPADRLAPLFGERQRGVLKRSVPEWLQEPDLRAIVLSFTEAGPRHGRSGALYVRLRKSGR
jgi:DNA-nicking Smr family endonuclease